MNLIDLHCDTAWKLWESQNGATLKENDFSVSLKGLRKGDYLAQFFACFVDAGWFKENQFTENQLTENQFAKGYELAKTLIERMKREIKNCGEELAFAGNYQELISNKEAGKISALLTLEEGGVTGGDLGKVEELYRSGIRLITLLWNYENCIGYPNSRDSSVMRKGLKPFGLEMVEKMNELGMIVDVSHMSDGGFKDVITHSKVPVIASHSNARALCAHPRNLTDEMIHALAEKGGIAGVNFYPAFIREDMKAGAEDIVRHIKYMVNAGGIDFVAIGTDFDGFSGGELEIQKSGQMELLYHALQKEGFSASEIEKIQSGNALRVIKEVL